MFGHNLVKVSDLIILPSQLLFRSKIELGWSGSHKKVETKKMVFEFQNCFIYWQMQCHIFNRNDMTCELDQLIELEGKTTKVFRLRVFLSGSPRVNPEWTMDQIGDF